MFCVTNSTSPTLQLVLVLQPEHLILYTGYKYIKMSLLVAQVSAGGSVVDSVNMVNPVLKKNDKWERKKSKWDTNGNNLQESWIYIWHGWRLTNWTRSKQSDNSHIYSERGVVVLTQTLKWIFSWCHFLHGVKTLNWILRHSFDPIFMFKLCNRLQKYNTMLSLG